MPAPALKAYDALKARYRRLRRGRDGFYRLTHPSHARRYRMNVGTIVESPTLTVRYRGGTVLGAVEEHFLLRFASAHPRALG